MFGLFSNHKRIKEIERQVESMDDLILSNLTLVSELTNLTNRLADMVITLKKEVVMLDSQVSVLTENARPKE